MNAQRITSKPLESVIEECTAIAALRGIAVLVPGDLHVWGKVGGNRSDLFLELLDHVPFQYLLTNGDLFDGRNEKRETHYDAEVLVRIRALDHAGRWIPVRGNHDRRLFVDPIGRTRHSDTASLHRDLTWLQRSRVTEHTLLSIVEGEVFFGPMHARAHEHKEKHETHPGSHDLAVLTIAGHNFLFEHGDAHDRFVGKLATKDDLMTKVASGAYDLLIMVGHTHAKLGHVSDTLKQQFSMWRGVCESVALGATKWAEVLGVPVQGTISGHTHYPLHTVIDGIPHVNVGSFRGHTPSFAIITGNGELLPPFVIKSESKK